MGYELYDLVALNDNESGVIINVGMERLKVINHLGVVKDVVPQEIRSKLNHVSLRNKSFDGYSNSFGVGDTLSVISGTVHLKLTGTVKHINKGNVWLHSNHYLKNSGIFVIKGRNCMLVGGSSSGGGNTGGMGMGNNNSNSYNAYAGGNSVGSSSQQSTPSAGISQRYTGGGGGNAGGRGGGGRGRGDTRNNEIGTTVRIIKGGFKGHLGQIVDVTSSHYSIEMLTKLKKVVIPKKDTIPVGNRYGSYEKSNSMPSMIPGGIGGQPGPEFGMGGGMGSSTPFLSAPTPIHLLGSETPALFGNETPYMGMSGNGNFDDDSAWKITDNDRTNVQNTSFGNASEMGSGVGGGGNSIISGLSGSMIGGNDRLTLPVNEFSTFPTSSSTLSASAYTPSAMSDFSVTPQHYSNTPLTHSSASVMGGSGGGGGNEINFMPGMVVLMKKGKHIGKFAVIHQIVDDVSSLPLSFFVMVMCFCFHCLLSLFAFLELQSTDKRWIRAIAR
jgi:hypothetical protein